MTDVVRRLGAALLALAGGALLPLCFPPLGWWPLTLVSIALLFVAIRGASARAAFYLGLLHGGVGYGLALCWLTRIFGTGAIALHAILGLFTALYCLLFRWLAKDTRSTAWQAMLAAVLWTAIEFFRSELFALRFPWITPGTALGPTYLSPVLGVYGASFLMVAAAFALTRRRTLALGICLSLVVLFLGMVRPGPVPTPTTDSLGVTVVQSEECFLSYYIALTQTADKDKTDLVVWPEYALPYDVRQHPGDMTDLFDLCASMDCVLVLGTKTVTGPGDREWRNTALVLDKNGVIGEYYKNRPVHFFNDGIAGQNLAPIRTPVGVLATPICFDCDYSEVARKMVGLGAEVLAVASFDAMSWGATQHLQHSMFFRLRAAETGRWVACAASSGVSQIIDPHGNAHQTLAPMKTGVISARISLRTSTTFFSRVGWLFPWLTMVAAVALLATRAGRVFHKRRSVTLNPQT